MFLIANPHLDDYLHTLEFLPNGKVELTHGECQAVRGEGSADYKWIMDSLIISNIKPLYAAETPIPPEKTFEIKVTIEDGYFPVYQPYRSDSYHKKSVHIFAKRYTFAYDPQHLLYLRADNDFTLGNIHQRKQIKSKIYNNYTEIDNVYYENQIDDIYVEDFLAQGHSFSSYYVHNNNLLKEATIYKGQWETLIENLVQNSDEKSENSEKKEFDWNDVNEYFLYNPQGKLLATAFATCLKTGKIDKMHEGKVYKVPVFTLTFHGLNYEPSFYQEDDLNNLKKDFLFKICSTFHQACDCNVYVVFENSLPGFEEAKELLGLDLEGKFKLRID